MVSNIDPSVFSRIKYWSARWGGSATGNYPDSKWHCLLEIWLQDDVTGEVIANGSTSSSHPQFKATAPTDVITIDETWENTVSLYYTAEWRSISGDPTGTAAIGNIQLEIR